MKVGGKYIEDTCSPRSTHEEVFKDHVTGQYDETIFRFRVPGGWIYTHTIIRFGSVDRNYVADTFVPDSK
jgi:hypothetical protein